MAVYDERFGTADAQMVRCVTREYGTKKQQQQITTTLFDILISFTGIHSPAYSRANRGELCNLIIITNMNKIRIN